MIPRRIDSWNVAYGLIAVNVVVFIVGMVMGDNLGGGSTNTDGLTFRAATWGGAIDVYKEWWRVFTGGFLHHGVFHLAVNMYSLYILGVVMERSLGRIPFTAVYFASLVSGAFGALLETPNSLVAGASGAIFGLLGAFAALSLVQGIGLFQTPLGPILAINLVISFTVRSISLGGHIGGLVGGFLVGLATALAIRRQHQTASVYSTGWDQTVDVGTRRLTHPVTVSLLTALVVAAASFVGALWAATRWPN